VYELEKMGFTSEEITAAIPDPASLKAKFVETDFSHNSNIEPPIEHNS
jgi:hypothetical protein